MIILNFSHPLTDQHLKQIIALTGGKVDRLLDIPVQFDNHLPFREQLVQLMQTVPLPVDDFQKLEILVNPPALNFITAVLLAELHGRMGYFPAIIRLRVVQDSLPPSYEVAEIINLNQLREDSRKRRFDNG